MRKIVAVFLLLAIVTVFASCKKEPENTNTTIGTNPVITTGEVTTVKPEPLTYILTTNPEKKVSMPETTRFEISTTISTLNNNYNDLTFNGGSVEKPSVNTSIAPSVPVPSTTKPTTTAPTTTKPTTTAPTTTTAVVKKPVSLIINSEASNSDDEEIILEIDNSSWTGDIKANTQNISVEVDGIPLETTVPLKVAAGKNADGNQEIKLDLSGKGVGSGSTISFTIPEGFLKTTNGAQYNRTYSASASY